MGRPGRKAAGAGGAARALVDDFDWGEFAFASAPGVPQPEALGFLLAAGLRLGTKHALKAALVGLDALVKSDSYDAVEGGFFARCQGRGWTDPVPEKPLVANARMVEALSLAGLASGREDLSRAASETAAWVDRVLSRGPDDLWADGQVADPEYFARMATGRSRDRQPAVAGRAGTGACAVTASALAVAGAAEENRSLVGRARLGLQSLLDESGAGRGGWEEFPPPGERVALAAAMLDVWCLTGDRTLAPPLEALVSSLGPGAETAAGVVVRLRAARRAGSDPPAAGPVVAAGEEPADQAAVGVASLAIEAGVIAVEGVAGSSLATGAFARCAPFGPITLVDTSRGANDENQVDVSVPGRPPAYARRRAELGRLVHALDPEAAVPAAGGRRP